MKIHAWWCYYSKEFIDFIGKEYPSQLQTTLVCGWWEWCSNTYNCCPSNKYNICHLSNNKRFASDSYRIHKAYFEHDSGCCSQHGNVVWKFIGHILNPQ